MPPGRGSDADSDGQAGHLTQAAYDARQVPAWWPAGRRYGCARAQTTPLVQAPIAAGRATGAYGGRFRRTAASRAQTPVDRGQPGVLRFLLYVPTAPGRWARPKRPSLPDGFTGYGPPPLTQQAPRVLSSMARMAKSAQR